MGRLPESPTRNSDITVGTMDVFQLGEVVVPPNRKQAEQPDDLDRSHIQSEEAVGDLAGRSDAGNVVREGYDGKVRVTRVKGKAARKRQRRALDETEYELSTKSEKKKGRFESSVDKDKCQAGDIIHGMAECFEREGR